MKLLLAILVVAPLVATNLSSTSYAAAPANSYFERTWKYTDAPVANGQASRTWMWGPEAFTDEFLELYKEAPNGQRIVQYFDKSRMEINHDPSVSPESIWYVTNGLLVKELVTGQLQNGDDSFQSLGPAHVNVAGDADDTLGPTYAALRFVLYDPPRTPGQTITQRLDRNGNVSTDFELSSYGVYSAEYVAETNHRIAEPFWAFMKSWGTVFSNGQLMNGPLFENPYFATGYPITEAYWATIKVAGEYSDVLFQCFERRCLTYTPNNAEGWQVEAGNVGQHYYDWKYGADTIPPAPPSNGPQLPAPPTPNIDTIPEIIVTNEWLHPDAAILAAFSELTGQPANVNVPFIALLLENAPAIGALYNLETAGKGSWNWDTRGFNDWIKAYLISWFPGLGDNNGYYRASPQYIHDQIITAVYEPESDIGRRMRTLELEAEIHQSGSGAYVYWWLLLDPYRWVIQMNVSPHAYDAGVKALMAEFNGLIAEYNMNPLSAPSFGDFLALRGYVPLSL